MGMSHAYGPAADKKEMTELLAQAVDKGYTFFDTAEVYGTLENPHDNEELLGEALKPYRNQIVLLSKCGIRFDETSDAVNKPLIPDGRPETIKKSVDGSLKRLQTDHLDLYYIHRIDRSVPIEETAGAMKELIEAGKITHWGISEADEETLRRAHAVCPVTAVQNRYSMMYRDYEALFPVFEERHTGADFPRLDVVQETVDRADPGHKKIRTSDRECTGGGCGADSRGNSRTGSNAGYGPDVGGVRRLQSGN